jgi:hypothetical protein
MEALHQARTIIDQLVTGEWNLLPSAFSAAVSCESWHLYSMNNLFAPQREHIVGVR